MLEHKELNIRDIDGHQITVTDMGIKACMTYLGKERDNKDVSDEVLVRSILTIAETMGSIGESVKKCEDLA